FAIELLVINALDDIELAVFCGHHHALADTRSSDERQRALEHVALEYIASVELLADAARHRHEFTEIRAHGLIAPARAACLGWPHIEPERFQNAAVGSADTDDRNTVHRGPAPPISAKRDH